MIPIAIYHWNIGIVSRGKGKSAVAAAAYRSGEKLTNEWDGVTHDYTRKGGVVHTEIMLPLHAPPSFSDRSTLWNSVELYEKAGNAQLAREIDAALPIELSREEQIRLVREYCSSQFVSRGMCVDYAIHDTDSGNPHCHIMLTMRPLDGRGTWAAKSKKEYDLDENGERIRLPSGRYKTHKIDLTGWNDKDNTLLWRKAWADFTNDFLERNGSPERIDHRSHAERGIEELPTVHMGVAVCQMEKKGIATEKGELNRNIQKANRLIREIRAQIGKLKEWIADLFKAWETAPKQPPQSPNLANLLMKYLSVQREKSRKYSQRWQQQHTADELKTIDQRFHCFGCGEDGDVIDFTAKLFDLSPKEAAEKLAQDFGLIYDSQAPPRRRYVRQKNEAQKFREDRQRCYRVLSDYYYLLKKWEADRSPRTPEEEPHPRFVEAIQKKAYVEYLLDLFLYESEEEQKAWIAEHTAEITHLERRLKIMAENKPTNRERLREITDGIEQGIKELFESEKYMRYLSVMSRFHRYSVNNTMLIYMQKPDATLVQKHGECCRNFKCAVQKRESHLGDFP